MVLLTSRSSDRSHIAVGIDKMVTVGCVVPASEGPIVVRDRIQIVRGILLYDIGNEW